MVRAAAILCHNCRAPQCANFSLAAVSRRYIMELGGADALGVTLRTTDMSAGEHKAPAFLSARPRFCAFCVLREPG